MAKRVYTYQHVFLKRLVLPWVTVLVAVALLLTSLNLYQERKSQIRSYNQQTQQSTLAVKNSFISMLDQVENIALIIQFSQQSQGMFDQRLPVAEQALAAYQYMQFLNTVKLGYPIVDSIWVVRDGYALSSDRTRYPIDFSRAAEFLSDAQRTSWVYDFTPQRIIGQEDNGVTCLSYLTRIWDAEKETDYIVAVHVSAPVIYRELLELSGLHDLVIRDQEGQAVLSAEMADLSDAPQDGTTDKSRQYAVVSDGRYTYEGAIAPEAASGEDWTQWLYPFLFFALLLGTVIVICYAITKRLSFPLCALVERFQSNASTMDNQTTMIVQKSLESMVRQDYLSRGEDEAQDITQEYRKLMDDLITPRIIEHLHLTGQYVILALEIDEPLHQNGNAERLMPYFERYVRSCLRNMVREDEKIYTVYVHDCLVAAAMTLRDASRYDEIDRLMSSLQEMLRAVSPCTVSMACSALHSDQADVRKAMTEAIEAIRWKLMRHPGCHIFYREEMDASNRFIFPKAKLLRVLSSLDKEPLRDVQGVYHEFLDAVTAGGASVDDLMLAYYQMLGQIIQLQIQRGIPSASIFMETATSPYRYMSSLEFSDHISAWLEEKIALLWKHLQTTNTVGNVYINSFREYMQKHYMLDVQPENVAAEIGISYSYLRRLLSKELNTTFSVYLLTLRLTRTKELLRTTQLTHKEIAEQVGFGSEQTLYRVFRQNEGCSPKEWRRTAITSLSNINATKQEKEGE